MGYRPLSRESGEVLNERGAVPTVVRYYDLVRNWNRMVPHLDDKELNAILVHDFNKYTMGLWKRRFAEGMFPRDFESCDWDAGRRGPRPRFWNYVKHGACHWLVNFNLRLATLAVPKRPWRIVTSDLHSTVWDGAEVLFDFNGLALRVPPQEFFELAWEGGVVLPPGQFARVGYAAWR